MEAPGVGAHVAAMEREPQPQVVLVEDHAMVAEALKCLLASAFDPIVTLGSAEALLDFLAHASPRLVICDIGLPGMTGLDALHELRVRGHAMPFLALTMHADPSLAFEVLRAGGQGYVLKSSAADELLRAIHVVMAGDTFVSPSINGHLMRLAASTHKHRGRPRLSDKRRQVLDLVIKGYRSKQIASQLGLSIRTIDSHRNALMHIYGVHSAIELVSVASGRREAFRISTEAPLAESPM